MSQVEAIKAEIDALTWEERCELNAAFQNWPEDAWGREMASNGKFERAMKVAGESFHKGECCPWPGA